MAFDKIRNVTIILSKHLQSLIVLLFVVFFLLFFAQLEENIKKKALVIDRSPIIGVYMELITAEETIAASSTRSSPSSRRMRLIVDSPSSTHWETNTAES